MKKTLISCLLIVVHSSLYAQVFSHTTNTISLDYTKEVTSTVLPQINWVTPKTEVSVSVDNSFVLELEINTDILLKDVTLSVSAGDEKYEKKLKAQEGQLKYSITQPVQLMPGHNTIKVIVENKNGGIVSSTRTIRVGKDALAEAVDVNRKDYALIFATDNYDNWGDLVNPIDDARAIEQVLKEKF